MNRTFGCIAALMIVAGTMSGVALAGDQGDPEQECGVSTYEMVECLSAKAAMWDKRMTIAYQRLRNAGPPKQREQLRTAQRLWVQYRDANCQYYLMGEGTIARVEAADCVFRMTRERTQEFEGKEDRN